MKPVTSNARGLLAIWVLLFSSIPISMAAEPTNRPLIDFSDASVAKQWISINDDVMGGVSQGGFLITDGQTLEFSGNISLEKLRNVLAAEKGPG